MCGIVAGFAKPDQLVQMLKRVQHRGFASAGLATNRWFWRSSGTVCDLIREHANSFVGDHGVAHVRYNTNNDPEGIQPSIRLKSGNCFDAFAFNGQVEDGDTEHLFDAVQSSDMSKIRGAYSYAYLDSFRCTVRAGRDPFGFHPLYYSPSRHLVASETCADLSISDWEPVAPGTEIDVATGEVLSRRPANPRRCFLEWVYFLSVQSEFDGVSVYPMRRHLGSLLAKRETERNADMIIPVPDTGIAAAEAMAQEMSIPFRMALYRERYAGRTFIIEGGFTTKYRIIPQAIHGKIILVDDSIVRGHTLNYLVPRLKRYADEVHVRVTCPPITHPCRYGINITEPGAHFIDSADSVRFFSVGDIESICGTCCTACVSGRYPDNQEQ